MRCAWLAAVLLAWLAPGVSAQTGTGATWTPKVNLSEGLGVQCSYSASIAVDVSGTVHVIWGECIASDPEYPPRSIYYSSMKGRVWSVPIDILTTPAGGAIETAVLQATSDGRLHVVWVQPAGYVSETYYSWAPIEGAGSALNWATPRLVHTSTQAVDFKASDDGSLRVIYTSGDPTGVFLATSRDLGRTWSHTRIYPQQADLVRLAVGERGTLHAVWQRDDNSERTLGTIYTSRSTDNGETWSQPFTVDRKAAGDARYTEAYRPNLPSIAVAGAEQVHIVWDGAPGGQRWHRWSADSGVTWSDPVQIDPLLRAITMFSPLVVDSAGVVHMVSVGHDWTKEGVGGVWYTWWDPGTRQWAPVRLIDPVWQNDYHAAAMAIGEGNRLYAVFQNHGASPGSPTLPGAMGFDIWFMEGHTAAPSIPAQPLPTIEVAATPTSTPTAVPEAGGEGTSERTAVAQTKITVSAHREVELPISPITAGLVACGLCVALVIAGDRFRHRE
jgi:hypothetical protein